MGFPEIREPARVDAIQADEAGSFGEVPVFAGFESKLALWMLRTLCKLGAVWSPDFEAQRFADQTRTLLPVPDAIINDKSALVAHYRKLLIRHESQRGEARGVLAGNLESLGQTLRLGQTERDMLAFLLVYDAVPAFDHVVDAALGSTDVARAIWQLSTILGVTPKEMEQVFHRSSVLMATGILKVNENLSQVPISILIDANHRVTRLLLDSSFEPKDMLHVAARPAQPSTLVAEDFEHMAGQRELVKKYLRAVADRNVRPASVLFDGPPGVGKTELARLLGVELGFNAWEINELKVAGEVANAAERMQLLRICQRMIEASERPLVIFDEADSVLGGHLDLDRRALSGMKAGLIHCLEDLRAPVIWITNEADLIDPAVLRRIDLHIRFRELPDAARERMLSEVLPAAGADSDWFKSLTTDKRVTPARIKQAARVAGLIGSECQQHHASVVRQVLQENLDLKAGRDSAAGISQAALPYRLDLINADEDLAQLVKALKRNPQARLCLYGPPGTGKTRFVYHLAEACQLKLVEYRASDLLAKYLGESEQNIRRMFEECDRPGRLLFVDEADSLVADRTGASQRWEISQVNELLKGLENFAGLFVASTNLMSQLDPAVMRRLDFKIHFDWLQPEQRWRLFLDLAGTAGLSARGSAARRLRERLDDIGCLTPGDFALLARRLSIRPVKSADELVELLDREAHRKPERRTGKGIGFTARLHDHEH